MFAVQINRGLDVFVTNFSMPDFDTGFASKFLRSVTQGLESCVSAKFPLFLPLRPLRPLREALVFRVVVGRRAA